MRVARLGAGPLLLFAFGLASADVAVPPLTARVIDLTGTLSGGAVARIEAKLADLEAKKGSQVAVLIVPTTQPEESASRTPGSWAERGSTTAST